MGKIQRRYRRFRWTFENLQVAVKMSIDGTCDRYWLETCVEAFEISKARIFKGLE